MILLEQTKARLLPQCCFLGHRPEADQRAAGYACRTARSTRGCALTNFTAPAVNVGVALERDCSPCELGADSAAIYEHAARARAEVRA